VEGITVAPSRRAISAVRSVDPSSTTITSEGAGSCPFSAPMTVPIVRSALNAGITTE
jgi:hypothetical protein